MIDITPLDVRNKRGDFKRILRGYDPQEVDVFLELVAERLEAMVRESLQYRERSDTLERQVRSQSGREQAVQEALVTAQELRADIQAQAQREADHVVKEAETEARRLAAEAEAEVRKQVRDAERKLELGRDALEEMERRRKRFLKAFRQLLEREIDVVEVEEERAPLEDRPIDLNLGGGRFSAHEADAAPAEELDEDVAAPAEALDDDVEEDVFDDGEEPETPSLDAPVDELSAAFEDASATDESAEDDGGDEGDGADDGGDEGDGADDDNETAQADAFASDGSTFGSDDSDAESDETLSLSFEAEESDEDDR